MRKVLLGTVLVDLILHLCLPAKAGGQQCSPRSLLQHLEPGGKEEEAVWSFPTPNRLYEGDSSLWRRAADAEKLIPTRPAASSSHKAVVVFYYSTHDPYSAVLLPVMECLPKFFPPSVLFFALDISLLPSTVQLNSGILGTPTLRLLQVDKEEKQFHYALKESNLSNFISFVETMGHVKSVVTPEAIYSLGGPRNPACMLVPLPVSVADIQKLGWNRWMLVACLFLAVVGVEGLASWRSARRLQA